MDKRSRQQISGLPETSSCPVGLSKQQRDMYCHVLSLFEERKFSYAIAGAFALREHTGIGRDTKDLDLFLTAANAPAALQCLREQGFDCEVCDPVWLHKAHRDEFFVDLITGMSNAALVVEPSWISRAIPKLVLGVPTRVLRAEELLASKLFVTRRERFDGADIAHLIYGTRGQLDWERIFSLAGEHWELLFWALILFRYIYPAQANYVPGAVWQDLVSRFQALIEDPNPAAKFRGSLIDDKMFAIDVKEWGLDNLMLEYRKQRLQAIPHPR